eukprot:249099-Rhodomonas_salina.2
MSLKGAFLGGSVGITVIRNFRASHRPVHVVPGSPTTDFGGQYCKGPSKYYRDQYVPIAEFVVREQSSYKQTRSKVLGPTPLYEAAGA